MNINVALACLAFAVVLRSVKAGPIAPRLKLVAVSEGKSFFVDSSKRDWVTSKAYCESMGMRLASITSQTQWTALQNAFDRADFYAGYWTSGTDSLTLGQFKWNSVDDITSSYVSYIQTNAEPLHCLTYYVDSTGGYVYNHPCKESWPVLCETG